MSHSWQAADARQLYNLPQWGEGYFDVSDDGHLLVRPQRETGPAIDIRELISQLPAADLHPPVLLRFREILHDRVDRLCAAFADAIQANDYRGQYHCVYPIKVNQQRNVIEQILRHGGERVGLEAGSKPELMAVLGMAPPQGLIVCNGYKDREYIRLGLIGQRMGHRIYLVIEKPSELALILEEAAALGVKPHLGIRVRLASLGTGKWQNSGGERAKFGLSATQVLALVDQLQQCGQLDCLGMLHFHLGSQIANLQDIRRGITEAARFYQELYRLGATPNVLDVGGGLGVDYEGTQSRSYYSVNYQMADYAALMVSCIAAACREHNLPEPEIITEAGRALTAHHAVLITNVIDSELVTRQLPVSLGEDAPPPLRQLQTLLDQPEAQPPLEQYHNAQSALAEAQAAYTAGHLSLEQRAAAEQLFHALCRHLQSRLSETVRSQRECLDELRHALADKLFCNLSVFQSLPDVWGIDQIFPILPVQRLDECPDRRAILCDLTCDSDGQIAHYVDGAGIEASLPVHALEVNEPYWLAFCMVGAYQEILGDMHNLFGDTDAVDVELDASGGWRLVDPEHGDRAEELLRYVHLEPASLQAAYEHKLAAVEDPAERDQFRQALVDGLNGYTYLK